MSDIFTEAIEFAARAHEGQVRKGSDLPYILHPMETAAICATITSDSETLAAAVLHDVVEDTSFTLEDIQQRFGARVAEIVEGESENKREELPAADTWRVRKQEKLDLLAATQDREVLVVCLGDKLSNIRALERDLEVRGQALWERFNQKDPAQHAWYYQTIAEVLEPSLGGTAAWKEYNARVHAVFEA